MTFTVLHQICPFYTHQIAREDKTTTTMTVENTNYAPSKGMLKPRVSLFLVCPLLHVDLNILSMVICFPAKSKSNWYVSAHVQSPPVVFQLTMLMSFVGHQSLCSMRSFPALFSQNKLILCCCQGDLSSSSLAS